MSSVLYFKQNFLLPIWFVGIGSATILVANFLVQKHKEKKFEKMQQQKKIQHQMMFKNKLSNKGL